MARSVSKVFQKFIAWLGYGGRLCILVTSLSAQNPELVPKYEKQLQAATTDSARAINLQLLSFNLAHSDPGRSRQYGEAALQVAAQSGNAKLLSECQNGVGWAFFSVGNYARARVLLDSSIQYMRVNQDYADLVTVCNSQGWVCLKQGDNLGALRYFREGLNAAEASKDQGRIAFMHRSLGSFYNVQKEYDKSIPHIQRAAEIFATLGDSARISEALLTLGNAYSGMGQNETAIDYYKKTYQINHNSGNLLEIGLLFENWGIALSQLGRFEAAFAKMEAARGPLEQLNEQIELAFLDLTIGNTYLMKGDTLQAIGPLEKARQISTQLQLVDVLSEALPALHTAYAATGAPEKAYQTLLAYQTLRDTTAADAGKLELQRLKTEFETERKEKDIQIKTLENTRLQAQFWLALAGLGLALMAGLAFWYRARQRRKTNAVLEAKNLEILAQKSEAERLRARAERSEAVKERFLAAMSHEIRTPMNAIVGLSQLLDAENHAPTTAHNISIIRQSGEHLMVLLNDVLDLAKIEAGKTDLRPQPLALLPYLQLVRDTFTARAQEKGLTLLLNTDENLPPYISADPVRLGQVLHNLVSNAIKFTHSGEVVLSVTQSGPTSPQATDATLTFSVRDTGIGIPLEKQAAVFEAFTQADLGVAMAYGGTGLGLNIARSLVAQMGGTLQLRSGPGQGAEFFFTLQVPIVRMENREGPHQTGGKTTIPKLVCKTPVRILLVEDNAFSQTVAQQTIAAICPDIVLEIAVSGAQALEWVKTRHFDLLLTDLQMPGMDGYETARRLRAAHFDRPIVALTASAALTDTPKCLEAGMQEMLLKPIAPSEMTALLLRYLPEKLAPAPLQKQDATSEAPDQDAPVPSPLLQLAGGNPTIARQLLAVIHAELSAYLPAIQQLRASSDDLGIKKSVHKMRPQLMALGLLEHKPLLDALEQNTVADVAFWENVGHLEAVLAETLETGDW